MHFHEDEAERLPIDAFDTLSSGRDRKTRFVWVRYRAPNFIERTYGLPVAVVAYPVATYFSQDAAVGLAAVLITVVGFLGMRNEAAKSAHRRMWEEVFALRGGLDHALTHLGDPCPECEKARKLVPEWDAAMRAKARAERASRSDSY